MLTPTLEAEIAELAARYGDPQRVVATIPSSAVQPLNMADRLGEVCMVFRRPGGALLTAIKTFYPRGCYRLLTGGVEHGERIEHALWREVAEETGLVVTDTRFLAVIEYTAPSAPPCAFATFAFLLDAPHGEPHVSDPHERLESFRAVALADLPSLAATLEQAPNEHSDEIGGSWRDWGVFRAVVHRVVYDLLNDNL
ncbi:MAG: NUDIX domain-containing protein [Chloroflexales bacterium]|nr:NUDIX domain-containing protein [Chloroflexales bacterium]